LLPLLCLISASSGQIGDQNGIALQLSAGYDQIFAILRPSEIENPIPKIQKFLRRATGEGLTQHTGRIERSSEIIEGGGVGSPLDHGAPHRQIKQPGLPVTVRREDANGQG
jgi:hypothetical protein